MSHDHSHDHDLKSTRNITVAFFLNLSFTVIEIIGGILTNSVAILSDALHDFGDTLSLGLAWYFQKVARKGRDEKFSYGYGRFSLLGAIVNSIILIVGCVIILNEAIPRLFEPEKADEKGMIFLAVLGILINGLAVIRLRKGTSINEEIVSFHLLEDVFGWVAVLIGALLMYFFDLPVIDPILSIMIATFILFNVYKSLRKTFKIVLQGVPAETSEEKINSYLRSLPQVDDIHDLHIWTLDGRYHILTVHIVADNIPENKIYETKEMIRTWLRNEGIEHATIEFESSNEACVHVEC